jgi:hypothetical protein
MIFLKSPPEFCATGDAFTEASARIVVERLKTKNDEGIENARAETVAP